MSIHPEDKSCSDLGRVAVLNGPAVGPYRQSERTPIYLQLAKQLVEGGFAYPCFCTDEAGGIFRTNPHLNRKWSSNHPKGECSHRSMDVRSSGSGRPTPVPSYGRLPSRASLLDLRCFSVISLRPSLVKVRSGGVTG